MATKYSHFKHYKRGVKRENGDGRLCMHCGRDATVTAFLNTGDLKLEVYLCVDHELVARSLNAS